MPLTDLDTLYRIVYVENQGLGVISPDDWRDVPEGFRGYVYTLCYCDQEELARLIFKQLPQGWRDEIKRRLP